MARLAPRGVGAMSWKEALLAGSLEAALREQGLWDLVGTLRSAVPDISRQYSTFAVDSSYLELKVRGQHAFQVRLALAGMREVAGPVVDVGDSSGTHIRCLKALGEPGRRYLSVNLDASAVRKVQAAGLEAVHARAEELGARGIDAAVFLCFETLEHLPDPAGFLHTLAAKTAARRLVLTVPYVARSRVGLHHIRAGLKKPVTAEQVHLFELCPEDLRLLFRHCGWSVVHDEVYLQYPRRSWRRLLKPAWKRRDFEGFYGAVLEPDPTWSSLYGDWP